MYGWYLFKQALQLFSDFFQLGKFLFKNVMPNMSPLTHKCVYFCAERSNFNRSISAK